MVPLKLLAVEAVIYEKKIHDDSIDSLCIRNGNIISASFDGAIKTTKDNKSKVIGKHKDWVRKLICVDSNLISASNDGTIAIWNKDKKINSVKAHSWWVTDIDYADGKIISVSLDEYVKVWRYPDLKLLYSDKIYGSDKHYTVTINNGKAFIGSTRGLMFVLDMNSFEWLSRKAIAGGKSVLTSSVKSMKYVFFGTSDGSIIKVATTPPFKIDKQKIDTFPIRSMLQYNGILYFGDSNGSIRKTEIGNLSNFYFLTHVPSGVRALALKNNYIYAGYDDGYLRIFDMKKILSKHKL